MEITPNKLTIGQLFTLTNEQFVVPAYQRRYAWGYNQIKALFDDIQILQDDDGHLFGMLIIHASGSKDGLYSRELVDGQQRITTLTLLLKAIQKRYLSLEQRDKASEIEKMLSCYGYNNITRNKLLLGDLDNDDYCKIMSQKRLDDCQNQNLITAFNSYVDWFSLMELKQLNKFYFKLTNVAVLIRLDVTLAKDAYRLFETINNRGIKLSPTDIIKNFLLGHAARLEVNSGGILEEVKSLWSKIILNLDSIDTDDFFRQFMCSVLQRKISKNKLVSEFKAYYFIKVLNTDLLGESAFYVNDEYDDIEDDDIQDDNIEDDERLDVVSIESNTSQIEPNKISLSDFLIDLHKASEVYHDITLATFIDPKINQRIMNLNRILSKPSYIFLMNFMRKDFDKSTKIEVLKMIENFMLRRHVCETRTSEHDDIFSKMNKYIESSQIVFDIKKLLLEYYPSDETFKINFPIYQFKGKLIDRAKYILEMIEYKMNGDTEELSINHSQVHLEHIIPQTIDTKKSKNENGDWEEYLGPKAKTLHKKYVNRIGNMTLLSAPLNISASNNLFKGKRKIYAVSNINITKDLKKFSNFKFGQVDTRGNDFLNIALEIWKLD